MLLQRRSPRRVAAGLVAVITTAAAIMLVADAWFDVCTVAAGRPLALVLTDMGVELGEAACCLLLAWAVWRERLRGRADVTKTGLYPGRARR